MAEKLSAWVKNISAATTNAVNVVADHCEPATINATWFGLQELLKTIFQQLFVFHVISFMFFCGKFQTCYLAKFQSDCFQLTHVSFVLESVFASSTVEVRGTLTVEDAVLNQTLFSRSISLETLLIDCWIFAMIVWVHLNVTCTDICLVAFILDAVIVGLLSIVLTVAKLNCAIVRWRES